MRCAVQQNNGYEGLKGGMKENMKGNVLIMNNMKEMKKENLSL